MKTTQSVAVQWSTAIFIGNRLVGKSLSKDPATLDSDNLKLSFHNSGMQKFFCYLAINTFSGCMHALEDRLDHITKKGTTKLWLSLLDGMINCALRFLHRCGQVKHLLYREISCK